jgi:hypothetical protein
MLALKVAAFILIGLGLLATGFNLYVSVVRFAVHRLLHRDKPYKWVSGIPIFGSLFLWIASVLLWCLGLRHWATGVLVVSFSDTGGLLWCWYSMAWAYFRDKT